jgi:hypothetical protein
VSQGLKDVYVRGVPTRWRALLHVWSGKRRCNSGSQCERHALLLLGHITRFAELQEQRKEHRRDNDDGHARKKQGERDSNGGQCDDFESREADERELFRTCDALLDQPDGYLTMRRTTALAIETIHEALVRAQQSNATYEKETMACVVRTLEELERHILIRFSGCPAQHGASEELALLVHMGRGMEVAERIAKHGTGFRTKC